MEIHQLTAFQRDTMSVVASMDEPKGLAIKRELEEVRDEDINHGRLYPNLDTLVEAGFINKGEKDKRTNSYSITAEGREALEEYQSWIASRLDGESTESEEEETDSQANAAEA